MSAGLCQPDIVPFIDGDRLIELVSRADAMAVVRDAMMALSGGGVNAPDRWTMPVGRDGLMALMPGSLPAAGCFGVKVLSLFPPLERAGAAGHQGVMLMFDLANGRPIAMIEASALTGLRTAAATAMATATLARANATTLALLGYGDQARWHVSALRAVRRIDHVRLWGRCPDKAARFARTYLNEMPEVTICETARDAVRDADIICTLTHATDPIVQGAWLQPGQHINIVGSSSAAYREIDDTAVARGLFVVDSRQSAVAAAGELLHAIAASVVPPDHIHAEIGEVLIGQAAGRTDDAAITIYKSLGHIVQDLAVGNAALRALRRDERHDGGTLQMAAL